MAARLVVMDGLASAAGRDAHGRDAHLPVGQWLGRADQVGPGR
jgi:hypothetical protein